LRQCSASARIASSGVVQAKTFFTGRSIHLRCSTRNGHAGAYTAKLGEIKLVDRLKTKYDLPDDETTALQYTLYRAVSDAARKTQPK